MTRPDPFTLLAMLAEQSGEQVSDARLEFIVRRLGDCDAVALSEALERLLESSRRFPTVDEIKRELGMSAPSTKDEGLLIADTILGAIGRYGSLQPGNAKGALAIERALGPAAWAVVMRQGGWNTLIDRAADNPSAFRAQIRDVAESYLRTGIIDRGDIPTSLPSHSQALDAVSKDPPLLPEGPTARGKGIANALTDFSDLAKSLRKNRRDDESDA